MSTDVVMPQMGESIAEGTIVRWIKRVGDAIDKDEPLFEISTDKVDAEIPSPGAGVLLEIKVKEGETVPVNSVVAVIGAAGEKAAGPAATAAATAPPAPPPPVASSGADGSAAPAPDASSPADARPAAPPPAMAFKPGEQVRIEKMGIMRKKIAEHMVMSIHTSPHVYSAYEVDFSRIEQIRQAKKAQYEALGAKLTYTA